MYLDVATDESPFCWGPRYREYCEGIASAGFGLVADVASEDSWSLIHCHWATECRATPGYSEICDLYTAYSFVGRLIVVLEVPPRRIGPLLPVHGEAEVRLTTRNRYLTT